MGVQGSLSMPLWSATPPNNPIKGLPVIWPKFKQPVQGYVLCARPEGCWVHFGMHKGKYRTVGCIGREHGCEACGPNARYRWQGYVPIWLHKRGRMAIAQVSKEAARNCPPLCDPSEILRGMFLNLVRLGEDVNSQVKAEVYRNVEKIELPPSPDVRESLMVLWGYAPRMSLFERSEEVAHA